MDLGKAIIEEVTQVRDPGTILKLVQEVVGAVEGGHLMLFLKDQEGQALRSRAERGEVG